MVTGTEGHSESAIRKRGDECGVHNYFLMFIFSSRSEPMEQCCPYPGWVPWLQLDVSGNKQFKKYLHESPLQVVPLATVIVIGWLVWFFIFIFLHTHPPTPAWFVFISEAQGLTI